MKFLFLVGVECRDKECIELPSLLNGSGCNTAILALVFPLLFLAAGTLSPVLIISFIAAKKNDTGD